MLDIEVTQKIAAEVQTQRAAREASYAAHMKAVQSMLTSRDPKIVEMVKRSNDGLAQLNPQSALGRTKAVSPGTVHVDAALSTISVQYKNGDYIGEELMPVAPVPKYSDKYFKYDKRSRLAYPDDAIGARQQANEINESRSQDNYSCQDYGYLNFVDAQTLANQDAPLNEMVDLVEATAEGVAFRREKRIAAIVTNANNYDAANKVTLAGDDQWDSAVGGNPVKVLQNARAALWHGRGPGSLVCWSNLEVYNVLARHPMILDLFKYGGTAPGLATPDMIAKFFGFDRYLVSEAREDTANEGQSSATYSRIWGKYFGVTRVATRPSIRNAAFGYTMRFGSVNTDQWFEISRGKAGGYFARVATSEDHKVVAADTSYLVSAAIS